MISQAYYVCWAPAAYSEIATVILVTISSVHLNLMITDEDFVWFMVHWLFVVQMLPQIFLVVGLFAAMFGCMIGSFLIADTLLGCINVALGMTVVLIVVPTWLCMLHINKKRDALGVEKVRKLLNVN